MFLILVIKNLDPDWIRIRIGIQPKMPYQMNTDPKPCMQQQTAQSSL